MDGGMKGLALKSPNEVVASLNDNLL